MADRYPIHCGCGDKIMVTDSTKREDFREHWRSDCPAPPTEKETRGAECPSKSGSTHSMSSSEQPETLDVSLVLGAGSDMPLELDVTGSRVIDRDERRLEIRLRDGDMEEFIKELRLDEV